MTDYISSRKRRNTISHASYIFLNISLAVISTLVTVISGFWLFGVLIVLFSKWRVFAVRPRYWWPGIKANAVDIIVGISFVFLIYFTWTNSTNVGLANPIYFILTAQTIGLTAIILLGILTTVAGTLEMILTLSVDSLKGVVKDGKDIVKTLKNDNAGELKEG